MLIGSSEHIPQRESVLGRKIERAAVPDHPAHLAEQAVLYRDEVFADAAPCTPFEDQVEDDEIKRAVAIGQSAIVAADGKFDVGDAFLATSTSRELRLAGD